MNSVMAEECMVEWQAQASVRSGNRPGHELAGWRRDLLRYVHRLTGDPDLAEDVAQEALLRLMKAAPTALANRRAWLFRTAINLVRDSARHERVRERSASSLSPAANVSPDEDIERAEKLGRIRAALAQLKPRDRELLLLRESGFSYSEIAEVLGVKPQSVSTLRLRALDRFRTAYCGENGDDASE